MVSFHNNCIQILVQLLTCPSYFARVSLTIGSMRLLAKSSPLNTYWSTIKVKDKEYRQLYTYFLSKITMILGHACSVQIEPVQTWLCLLFRCREPPPSPPFRRSLAVSSSLSSLCIICLALLLLLGELEVLYSSPKSFLGFSLFERFFKTHAIHKFSFENFHSFIN